MSESQPTSSPPSPVRVRHFLTLALWALAIGLFLYFFSAAKLVLLGFLGAACFAAALLPLKRHVPGPRWVRAFTVGILPLVITVALVALLSWALAGPIRQEIQNWPRIRQTLNDQLANWSTRFGLEQPLTLAELLQQAGDVFTGPGTRQLLSQTATVVTSTMIALAFIFFGTIFLLGEREDRILPPLLALVPKHRRPQVRDAIYDLIPRLRWWLIGTLASMVIVGVASGIGYAIVGVEFAIPLAFLAGVSEIVPTFGPAVTFLIAIVFAATQGTGVVVGVIIVYLIIQAVESNLITPFIMKEAVSIPPVITLFTIVLWGHIFGFPGLLLAIPINLVIWTFADHLLIRPRREP